MTIDRLLLLPVGGCFGKGWEDRDREGEKSETVLERSCRRPGPEPQGQWKPGVTGPIGDQEPEARREEGEGA